MKLSDLHNLAQVDLEAVNDTIRAQMVSRVPMASAVGEYLIESGGKRLRPLTLILAASCFGDDARVPLLAAAIEFIHTATLLHDDVVDDSGMRRGKLTANRVWSNAASVLVGDFLYSRAFQLLVKAGEMQVMDIMADTTNQISEGEVLQLAQIGNPEPSIETYYQIIECKTACLFAAGAKIGALLTSPEHANTMSEYGLQLGLAFQISDDWLDYAADSAKSGKSLGGDLSEGKATLPILYALESGNEQQKQALLMALTEGQYDFENIMQILVDTNALEKTLQQAEQHAKNAIAALDSLPESEHKQALIAMANLASRRSH